MPECDRVSPDIKLSLEKISVTYTHRNRLVVALEGLSFHVADKELLCILGPSGCGKSTILHLIAGFVRPTSGEINVNGHTFIKPGSDRAVVFQRHNLFPWKTVKENIEFGPRMRGLPKGQRHEIVSHYLEAIELSDFANSYPSQLSEGMQQRVGLARAYANDPEILLMDEPFASLDAQTVVRMRELLLRIWSENPKTIIFVTHDTDEAIQLADRVLLLSARPGSVRAEFRIDLPRPRVRDIFANPQYVALRKTILDSVFDGPTNRATPMDYPPRS